MVESPCNDLSAMICDDPNTELASVTIRVLLIGVAAIARIAFSTGPL